MLPNLAALFPALKIQTEGKGLVRPRSSNLLGRLEVTGGVYIQRKYCDLKCHSPKPIVL